jgi:6-phosphogluconolactonase (cycloisomerase 2 family)
VTNSLQLVQNAIGSSGVVFLEFNADKTRLVGASFGQGKIDIWDISQNTLVLMKQLVSDDALGPNAVRQDAPHPHQALLDNTGRFFVVNDLGTDTILVIDSLDDQFEIVNRVRVSPDGCGPRHGAFFPVGAEVATHYFVLCELLNLVEVFELTYLENSINFVPVQVLSTFGQDFPPVNLTTSTAGEIAVSADNLDVYVSNRNTGNQTDSISHFRVVTSVDEGLISLDFSDSISSGGQVPRMFSLSADQTTLFSTNQAGDLGLLALTRTPGAAVDAANVAAAAVGDFNAAVLAAGALDAAPQAAVSNVNFGAANLGPQFAMQIA